MHWESVWKASVKVITCFGVALCAMACGKRSTSNAGSCVAAPSHPQTVARSGANEYFGDYASDGKYLYVIVGGNNTDRLDRIPLDGGPSKTLIPRIAGAWQPEIYGPVAVTPTSLVVQRSVVAGERFNTLVLSTYELASGRETHVRLPPTVKDMLQVMRIDALPNGDVMVVAHDGDAMVVLRFNPAIESEAHLVHRLGVQEANTSRGLLDAYAFDGTKHMLLVPKDEGPYRVTKPASGVAFASAPADAVLVDAHEGRVYVMRYSAWTNAGEESEPTRGELDVIDEDGLRVLSRDLFFSPQIRDGYLYGLRRQGAHRVVRFRRKIERAALKAEEVLVEGDENSISAREVVVDACGISWHARDTIDRRAR